MKSMLSYADLAGWFSIFCWVVVFTPQIVTNYQTKSGKSLSLTFLWIWLVADVFSIIGAILENLLYTIIILAIYYTIADAVLIFQVNYYGYLEWRRKFSEEIERLVESALRSREIEEAGDYGTMTVDELENDDDDTDENQYTTITLVLIFMVTFITIWVIYNIFEPGLAASQICGWISAVLYIASRVPQIVKNYRNRSTSGLSLWMFILGMLGNISFCLSVLLESTAKSHIARNLPWLVGAGGTLIFDLIITIQICKYSSET